VLMSSADPPMTRAMALLGRYRITLAIVAVALATVAGVFAFARPEYDVEQGSKMIEIADLHHYSLAEVRVAFAKHGLPLRYDNDSSPILMLGTTPPGTWDTTAFYVYHVTTTSGRMSWGLENDEAWEKRFGNLLVHYGGTDEAVLERVKAAVSELD
jgi:hypothetical protein